MPMNMQYSRIILPTRPQPDTLVAIFILKTFGEYKFSGISQAKTDFLALLPVGKKEEDYGKEGVVLLDIGGGRFDHHGKEEKMTTSTLIAEYLGVKNDPALSKLLQYTERDDFFGKGTISNDPLDRAFGLSGLITALNKNFDKNPERVVEIILPLIEAHYKEEVRRTKELPEEFENKRKNREAEIFEVKQGDKKLKVIIIESVNTSMPGFLRSKLGGAFDVVAQRMSSGHVNILTRPTKRIDLRSLIITLRLEEMRLAGDEVYADLRKLSSTGRLEEIPEWYYDPATNSILNGGMTPKDIPATKISKEKLKKVIEIGLSEKLV